MVYVLELQRQLAADSQMQDLQGILSRAKHLCNLDMQCRTLSHSSVNTTSQDGLRIGSVLICNLPCIPQDHISTLPQAPLESSAVISAENLLQHSTDTKALVEGAKGGMII